MERKSTDRSSGNPRRVTLADVAAHVGTSTITVSRALRRPQMVSEALRRQIAEAVDALGYVPDPAAQALVSRRSNVIGVLIPSVTNNVFAEVLSGLYDTVAPTPYSVQIGNTRYDPEIEERLIRVFLGQRPAGLIVAGVDQTAAARGLLEQASCPLVQIMDLSADPVAGMIGFSHRDGARLATEHLIAQGYRAPAFIGARMDPRSLRRQEGFHEALASAGMEPGRREVTTTEPSSVGLGSQLLRTLLDQAPETDAVFCNNDDLALGVQFEAQRRGLRIGEAFGICGFNDLDVMAAAYPPITSVRTFRRRMGEEALKAIVERIENADAPPVQIDLGFELKVRSSTERSPTR